MINNSGTVGVDSSVMADSQLNLGNYSEKIADLIDELEALKNQLPAHWEGDDLDLFTMQFNDFEQKLSELPAVISSIASWAGDTTSKYVESETSTKASFGTIFGGLV